MYNLKRKIVAWWKLQTKVWVALILGYLWVVISFLIWFKVPSSGAILGASALIAELYFEQSGTSKRLLALQNNPKVTWATDDAGENLYQFSEPNAKGGAKITAFVEHRSLKKPAQLSQMEYLRRIAPEAHFDNTGGWFARQTIEYHNKFVTRSILITALAGAVLWGYGDIFYP